jgi:hypothetical protein
VTDVAAITAAAPARRYGAGVTALILGILLVLGVALWLVIGSALFLALVWVFPIVVAAAIVIGSIHLIVAVLATVFGVRAIARNEGRITGIIGLVLTLAATVVTGFVGYFFAQTASALSTGSTF